MLQHVDRQRSIRAVFDHSWSLITARERAVIQALSVFRGGFTRQAAQQVTGISLRELMALANKSLLTASPETGRYEVHELLRQFSADEVRAVRRAIANDAASGRMGDFNAAEQAVLALEMARG